MRERSIEERKLQEDSPLFMRREEEGLP